MAGVHAPRPIGGLFHGNVETRFAEVVLIAQDDAAEVVAYAVPFVLGEGVLPDNGWDFVIRSGVLASLRGHERRDLRGRDRRSPRLPGHGCFPAGARSDER